MKSVSALILVCAFACASAQFGVKGGASGSSSGVRAGPFFPRLTPGSIQEKKEQLQLANVDEVVGGPSVVVGGGSNGNGFVQPAGQPENVVTFVQERPTQSVLVPSSGSVSPLPSVGSVAPVSTSVGPQTQLVQSVSPVQSSFSFVPSFQPVLPAPAVGQVAQVAQVAQPAVQSFQSFPSTFAPLTKTFQPNGLFFDNRQPAQQLVQFGAAPVNPSFPNFAQNIVHFAAQPQPQPQVSTVQTVPAFASNGFASGAFGPVAFGQGTVGKVGKQFVAPTIVSQQTPLQSFPAFQSFPSVSSGFSSVPAVPSVSTGFAVPSVSSAGLPVSSFPSAVNPSFSGKLFTDNKISSGFGSFQQQLPSPVISQEKQSAETVQTTEW